MQGLRAGPCAARRRLSSTVSRLPELEASKSKAIWQRADAMRRVKNVSALLEPPSALEAAARALLDVPGVRQEHWTVVAELEANPFIGGRQELIRALALRAPEEYVRRGVPFGSHAQAMEACARLPRGPLRNQLLGTAVRLRFADAPFMPLDELWSALRLWADDERHRPVCAYVAQLAASVHRMQTVWERDALRAAGSSLDAQRARALAVLYALERDLASSYPAVLDLPRLRRLLLDAYSILRAAPVHAARHWAWLVARPNTLTPHVVDSGLRAARDADGLTRVWDACAGVGHAAVRNRDVLLAGHYARIGHINVARHLAELSRVPHTVWQLWARIGRPPPDTLAASRTLISLERYRGLTESGIDFDGVDWMLNPFSLYAEHFPVQQTPPVD